MIVVEAQRTLVKSPPELWGLLSEPESLARHLADFGEMRIVSSEPESAVAWEGEGVTGTVALKASGWGTKVTITATRPRASSRRPSPSRSMESSRAEPEPVAIEPRARSREPEPKIASFFARIFRRRKARRCPSPVEPD